VLASRLLRVAPFGAAVFVMLTGAASAIAADERNRGLAQQRAVPSLVSDAPADTSLAVSSLLGRSSFSITGNVLAGQHGPISSHLPAVRENVELISKLELNTPVQYRVDPDEPGFDPADPTTGTPDATQPPIVEGQIADVAIFQDSAFLASWSEPSCRRGGFFSVDISDEAAPRQLAFVPALPGTYHGEGMHVVKFNGRDILAVNNEPCAANGVGGFDLYDVTNPAHPITLVQGAGDKSPDTPADTGLGDTTQDPAAVPNSAHSVFLWTNANKLYAVIVDNTELHDVDIFDVTDPATPEFIADVDLVALADEQSFDLIDSSANGDSIFHHDMVVKKIGNVQTMLVSYWDAGYVKLNVNNPANPRFIGDSDFGAEDPLVDDPRTPAEDGFAPPEGNGHEAEFSHDNKYVLAADEDFGPYRFDARITDGPNAGFELSATQGSDVPLVGPGAPLVGDTKYVGEACTPASIDPPGGVPIALIARGTCSFQEKYDSVVAAGYSAGIVFNSNSTVNGCDTLLSMLVAGDDIPFLFVARNEGMRLLGLYDPSTYKCTPGNAAETFPANPAPPADSAGVSFVALFDGWGYTHLYDNTGADLEAVDHFAIEEGIDERYAFGFGDLSVHEFATDPDKNVAYSSYYAGGMRVFTFGEDGLEQTGKFIDQGGNNFWGVEVVTTEDGDRLFAGSDRDFGLYLLRYVGPKGEKSPPSGPPSGPPQSSSPPPGSSPKLADPLISGDSIRVGSNRIARVGLNCPVTASSNCRGILTIGRRGGATTLGRLSFSKPADVMSKVGLRLSKREFRRLVAVRRQRVTVELLTRGSDNQLRRAAKRVTLLAPRR
jgi:hypothetical protein